MNKNQKAKRFTFCFTFNDLPAGHAQQAIVLPGNNLSTTLRRALDQVKKRPAVKGKRITSGRITFSISAADDADEVCCARSPMGNHLRGCVNSRATFPDEATRSYHDQPAPNRQHIHSSGCGCTAYLKDSERKAGA